MRQTGECDSSQRECMNGARLYPALMRLMSRSPRRLSQPVNAHRRCDGHAAQTTRVAACSPNHSRPRAAALPTVDRKLIL